MFYQMLIRAGFLKTCDALKVATDCLFTATKSGSFKELFLLQVVLPLCLG